MPTLFSQTAEYALRAMAVLAVSDPGVLVPSEVLSEAASIPGPYVPKVMRPMVVAGLVDARRGRGGGFRLASPPSRISLLDVLTAAGALGEEGRCAFGHEACSSETPCMMHDSWTQLNQVVNRWALSTTLSELGAHGAELKGLTTRT